MISKLKNVSHFKWCYFFCSVWGFQFLSPHCIGHVHNISHHLPTLDLKREVVDDNLVWPGGVGEADVLELDVAEEAVIGDGLAAGPANRRSQVDVLENTGAGRHA